MDYPDRYYEIHSRNLCISWNKKNKSSLPKVLDYLQVKYHIKRSTKQISPYARDIIPTSEPCSNTHWAASPQRTLPPYVSFMFHINKYHNFQFRHPTYHLSESPPHPFHSQIIIKCLETTTTIPQRPMFTELASSTFYGLQRQTYTRSLLSATLSTRCPHTNPLPPIHWLPPIYLFTCVNDVVADNCRVLLTNFIIFPPVVSHNCSYGFVVVVFCLALNEWIWLLFVCVLSGQSCCAISPIRCTWLCARIMTSGAAVAVVATKPTSL